MAFTFRDKSAAGVAVFFISNNNYELRALTRATTPMSMTHYMELLATNQPWHLIIFMAIPVILAETIAVTELYILFNRPEGGLARQLNRIAGMIVGPYFLAIFAYLMVNAVIPLTLTGGWRGTVDVIAVGSYLLGVIPLTGLSLIEFGFIGRGTETERLGLHAVFVALFLIVAHVAMIAGMLSPAVFGFTAPMAM
jgi:hypothetical protein